MAQVTTNTVIQLLVSGRVQGVGFRYFTRREAARLGLAGWVKNLPSGDVEARVAGPAEAVAEFCRRLQEGPPGARVDRLTETPLAAPAPWREFTIEI